MAKYIAINLMLLLTLPSIFTSSLACPTCPTPTPPAKKLPPPPPPPPPPKPLPCPPPPPPPVPCPPPPAPKAPAAPSGSCPIDTLKLDACVDLLGGLLHVVIGQDVKSVCCPLLEGVVDADAALCLCTTIKAKVLNLQVILPIALELLLDCGKHVPANYQCPA